MRPQLALFLLLLLPLAQQPAAAQVLEPVALDGDFSIVPASFASQGTCCCCGGGHDAGGHGHGSIKHGRVDTHAPTFLTGAHVHKRGQWMLEYKYANMYMDGNRAGTTRLTDLEALNFIGTVPPGVPGVSAYAATPTSMTMEMHMAHVMYGVTDDVTAYIMPMWMVNTMDHLRRNDTTFTVANGGFSDLRFGALWRIYDGCTDEVILNIGFSAPTGDIDNMTSIPTGSPSEYPYPMRLGSGTWDARPGITYRSYYWWGSIGLQGTMVLPMGINDQSYRMGNEYRANAWVSYLIDSDKNLAATFRVEGLWRSNYIGADPQLNPNFISTADPDMRGGDYLNFGYGLMYMLPKGGRLSGEVVTPIVQNLRGVQLERDWAFAISYSKAF